MEQKVCSFCDTVIKAPTKALVSRDTGKYICEDCIKLCYKIISPATRKKTWESKKRMTPAEIKHELDKSIIGQEDAKTSIAIAVYNHYKRIDMHTDIKLSKSNILLVGPTGCGKTLIAKTVADLLDVPFAIADCTSLTEAGFVGDDVESVLYQLIQNADGDIEKAEHGIVFLDEIDKLASINTGTNITKDPSGAGVQQALLKLVEGTIANVAPHGGRKNPTEKTDQINTDNILFICSGAFQGLDKIIKNRITPGTSIGFGTSETKAAGNDKNVMTEDLIQYGMIPELVGRLPVVVSLNELTEEALVEILTKPRNSIINQYKEMFAFDGVELEFTDDVLKEIAQEAISKKTGARGLRSIIEEILKEPMFNIPSDPDVEKCIIEKDKRIVFLNGEKKTTC